MKKYLFVFLVSIGIPSRADTLLSPGMEFGNSASLGPFLIDHSTSSIRYQQVYSASDFAPLATQGGGTITAISFRIGQGTIYMLPVNLANVQITLSTTTKTPDNLDSTFSANIGADVRTVFGPSPLHLPFSATPDAFILTIPFTIPFYYDAAVGRNLLLDVSNWAGKVPGGEPIRPTMAAQNTFGDSVSSVYALNVNATAGTASTVGLLTQFTYTPVPEPNALVLFTIGFGPVLRFRSLARGRERT
jgi:hypothetical protein